MWTSWKCDAYCISKCTYQTVENMFLKSSREKFELEIEIRWLLTNMWYLKPWTEWNHQGVDLDGERRRARDWAFAHSNMMGSRRGEGTNWKVWEGVISEIVGKPRECGIPEGSRGGRDCVHAVGRSTKVRSENWPLDLGMWSLSVTLTRAASVEWWNNSLIGVHLKENGKRQVESSSRNNSFKEFLLQRAIATDESEVRRLFS